MKYVLGQMMTAVDKYYYGACLDNSSENLPTAATTACYLRLHNVVLYM
jgi:hypothetical protein